MSESCTLKESQQITVKFPRDVLYRLISLNMRKEQVEKILKTVLGYSEVLGLGALTPGMVVCLCEGTQFKPLSSVPKAFLGRQGVTQILLPSHRMKRT